VHEARAGVEFGGADPDLDLRLRLDVAHPVGALALGNKVELTAMFGEPDFDFTRLIGDTADGVFAPAPAAMFYGMFRAPFSKSARDRRRYIAALIGRGSR
jgi:hypothetical protein